MAVDGHGVFWSGLGLSKPWLTQVDAIDPCCCRLRKGSDEIHMVDACDEVDGELKLNTR